MHVHVHVISACGCTCNSSGLLFLNYYSITLFNFFPASPLPPSLPPSPFPSPPLLPSQIFVDFGKEFVVSDTTGEQPISVLISAVSTEEDGIVTCSDETRHNLESGDYVTFAEVQVRNS